MPRVDPALLVLRADPSWLLPADACPADIAAPGPHQPGDWLSQRCEADLRGCLARCRDDDATACYASALQLQMSNEQRLSEALFLRACKLGSDSGCTNRAAGILLLEPQRADRLTCSARTFEETCRRRDAWGCTMYGSALLYGHGVAANAEHARAVLPFACSLDEADEACLKARLLLEQLDAAERQGKPPLM